MNKVIYKYEIKHGMNTLPVGQVLDYECQDHKFYVWILHVVDEKNMRETKISILGTGSLIRSDVFSSIETHVKTIHHDGFVWHLFAEAQNGS